MLDILRRYHTYHWWCKVYSRQPSIYPGSLQFQSFVKGNRVCRVNLCDAFCTNKNTAIVGPLQAFERRSLLKCIVCISIQSVRRFGMA